VGIGIAAPHQALDIEGSLQIHKTAAADSTMFFSQGNTSAAPTREWQFRLDTSNVFHIKDNVGGADHLSISSAGKVSVTEYFGAGLANPLVPIHVVSGVDGAYITRFGYAATQVAAAEFYGSSTNVQLQLRDGAGAVTVVIRSSGDTSFIGGKTGFGISAGLAGQVHIDQAVDDANIPAIVIDQADISEGTINFIASDRGVIDEGDSSVESVRVELGGVVRRLALYADA
jgi:hypothetical protein